MDLRHECAMRINQVGGPGRRELDPRTFEEVTAIPCEELVSRDGASESGSKQANRKPASADWSPREFGGRFFPEDDVDPGDLDL